MLEAEQAVLGEGGKGGAGGAWAPLRQTTHQHTTTSATAGAAVRGAATRLCEAAPLPPLYTGAAV